MTSARANNSSGKLSPDALGDDSDGLTLSDDAQRAPEGGSVASPATASQQRKRSNRATQRSRSEKGAGGASAASGRARARASSVELDGERPEAGGLWRNRIVRHAKRNPTTIKRHELNWRTHPPEQMAALRQMLDEVGWVQNVIVNVRTGRLIDGHARVELAIERGEKQIPIVEVDLSPEEERKVLAALDPISAMATVDTSNLGALLNSFVLGDDALSALFRDLGKRNAVLELPETEVKEVPARDVQWMVLVECTDEDEQTLLLERFAEEGLNVRALIG